MISQEQRATPPPIAGPHVASGPSCVGCDGGGGLFLRPSLLQAPYVLGVGKGGILQQSPQMARAASPQLCSPRVGARRSEVALAMPSSTPALSRGPHGGFPEDKGPGQPQSHCPAGSPLEIRTQQEQFQRPSFYSLCQELFIERD